MNKEPKSIFPTNLVDFDHLHTIIASVSQLPASDIESKKIISLIDLTSLEGKDTPATISELCDKAVKFKTAAICVYPTLVNEAKIKLINTGIRCASVAGGFPSGQTSLDIKKAEVAFAIEQGADEIDFVISRNLLLQGEFARVQDEIATIKDVCGKKIKLKAILETGELPDYNFIYKASQLAIEAGSDFIKTSTGKIQVNATLESVGIMLLCIKNNFEKTGTKTGIKPSGGISDANTAAKYLRLTESILGKEWITPELFRFGASRLASTISLLNENNSAY